MKKLMVVLLAVVLILGLTLSSLASEEGDSQANWFSLNLNSTLRSDFVGTEGYRIRGPVVVSDLTVGLPWNFYFYMWNLTGLDRSQSNEIDFYLGWARSFGNYNLDVGLGYWDINKFLTSDPEKNVDYWNLYVQLSRDFFWSNHTLSPYVKLSWIEPVDTGGQEGFEGGVETALGLKDIWNLGKIFSLPVNLESNVYVLHDPGCYGGNSAFIGRGTFQAVWQINDSFAVILPQIDMAMLFSDDENRGNELSLGVGLRLTF